MTAHAMVTSYVLKQQIKKINLETLVIYIFISPNEGRQDVI